MHDWVLCEISNGVCEATVEGAVRCVVLALEKLAQLGTC